MIFLLSIDWYASYRRGLRCFFTLLVIIGTSANASAQTAVESQGSKQAQSATVAAIPKKPLVIEKSDLLNNLDEVKRQYPKLYERLRRERPAHDSVDLVAVDGSASRSTPVAVDVLLRQDVVRNSDKQTTNATGGH